jgi:hypothetical protein
MAERLERNLIEGKVYYFSNGTVSPSNRKYSTIDNDYKINFSESKSEVKEAEVQVCLGTQFVVLCGRQCPVFMIVGSFYKCGMLMKRFVTTTYNWACAMSISPHLLGLIVAGGRLNYLTRNGVQDASNMKAKCNFTKIDCLATKIGKKVPVDVVAVVTSVGPLSTVTRQSDSTEFLRRCSPCGVWECMACVLG